MQSLIEYIMRGRKQAVLTALLFSVLPFLAWMGDVIMVLVTLRKGPKEGAIVLLWILLPNVVAAFIGYPQYWIFNIVGGILLTYGLAVVLRQTASWAVLLQMSALAGVIAIIILHLYKPDIATWWTKEILDSFAKGNKDIGFDLSPAQLQTWAAVFAKVASGVIAAFLVLGDLFNIAIARWMQALLYNPGGLHTELYNIRLGKIAVGALLLVIAASVMGSAIAQDCLPVVAMPFLLAGLSLVHCLLVARKTSLFWLIWIYLMLLVIFFYLPLVVIAILMLLALTDCWIDLRQKWQRS